MKNAERKMKNGEKRGVRKMRGRPKSDPECLRSKFLHIRVTDRELRLIKELAEAMDCSMTEAIVKSIREAHEPNRKSEWISVKERLPEKEGFYLVWVSNSPFGMSVERLFKDSFAGDHIPHPGFYDYDLEDGVIYELDVTHWMPLPEAPKEEE